MSRCAPGAGGYRRGSRMRAGIDASGPEGRRRAQPDERIEAAVAAADQPEATEVAPATAGQRLTSAMERTGIEPVTPCLQSRCSPN